MMRSLFAGVQGLRAHQVRMDVIGNNIANVNTIAFKASRVNFADMYSQTIRGAASPTGSRGGINPTQVGLGVGISSIDVIQTEGSMQVTGKATDLAISGSGFFVLRDGSRYVYTRAGAFDFDSEGYLVNPATGQRVQGWLPDGSGNFPTRDVSTMTDIQLPVADSVLASPTSTVVFDQSLNAAAPVGTVHETAFTVIDSLGTEHTITLQVEKVADNVWQLTAVDNTQTPPQPLTLTDPYGGPVAGLQFNSDGSLVDPDGDPTTPVVVQVTGYAPQGGAAVMDFGLDFTRVMQPALPEADAISTLRMLDYDGYPTGSLTNISVDPRGVITGYYTNGQYREVAQVALANFFNPGGLVKTADNNWMVSPNSGHALIGQAGEAGRGLIAPSTLEMSNVDIAAEFTNMIVTQRGFQANSRIITTTDELLQEVVNLKR